MHISKYYAYNPNYRRGFIKMADGVYIAQTAELADAYYNDYYTLDIAAGSKVRRADVHGELQIDVDNSVLWVPETKDGIQKNPNTADYGEALLMQPMNLFYMNSWANGSGAEAVSYEAAEHAALSPVTAVCDEESVKYGNCDTWHQVTVTFQNDKIGFNVDGTEISVPEEYGILGGVDLKSGAFSSFRKVNKGRGLRGTTFYYSEGSDPNDLRNESANAQLLLEWLTNEHTKFYIGGTGSCAGQYNLASESNPFYMDDINFYGELLSTEQVQALYQKERAVWNGEVQPSAEPSVEPSTEPSPAPSEPVTAEAVLGDVDGDGAISLKDAQITLKMALKIELDASDMNILEADRRRTADVNSDGIIDLADAQKILKAALKLEKLEG